MVVTGALYALTKYTRAGLAMTGVAENETATAALGWSPDSIAIATWATGAALAGLAGVLAVPITGLQSEQITPLITFATAAALLGSFYSFWSHPARGIAHRRRLVRAHHSVDQPRVGERSPARADHLHPRRRAAPRSRSVGSSPTDCPASAVVEPRPVVVVVALVVVSWLTLSVFGINVITALTDQLVAGVILLSIVLLTGYAGQISLGQYAVAGLGAVYASKLVASLHWPFIPAVLVGVIGATATGVLIGLPALRTRGVSLAVVTLALGYVIETLVLSSSSITGGIYGTSVGSQSIFGLNIDPIVYPARYAVVCLIAFALVSLGLANLRRGRVGRRLVAIRDNERAAASVGIGVTETKTFAFAAASAVAGLGGILLAFSNDTVVFQNYTSVNSISAVAGAVVGGIGFVTGPIVGSFFASGSLGALFLDKIGNLGNWLPVITGVALIATLLATPDGQVAEIARVLRSFADRLHAGGRTDEAPRSSTPAREEAGPSRDDSTGRRGGDAQGPRRAARGQARRAPGRQPDRRRCLVPDRAGRDRRPDRAQRRGQDDGDRHDQRLHQPGRGRDQARNGATRALGAHRRVRTGVARSFQGLELFEDLTVLENVHAACDVRDRLSYLTGFVRLGRTDVPPIAWHALDQCRLLDKLDRYPEELSYGQRRLVAIVRAVATGASILLLDEPAAGLSHGETAELSDLVTWLAHECGAGVLLVEHDVAMVMTVCDRIGVLQGGKLIASGTPVEVRENEDVVTAYLGA